MSEEVNWQDVYRANTKGWRELLPTEYKDAKVFDRFDGTDNPLGEVAKSWANLDKMIQNSDKVAKPDAEWTNEQWNDYYSKIGVPATAAEYELGEYKPSEAYGDQSDRDLGMLHSAGLTARQARAILETLSSRAEGSKAEKATATQQLVAQAEQKLKEQWGLAYEQNTNFAMTAAQEAWGQEMQAILALRLEDGTVLSQHSGFKEGLAVLGKPLGETAIVTGGGQNMNQYTPDEAAQWIERNRIRAVAADLKRETGQTLSGEEAELSETYNRMNKAMSVDTGEHTGETAVISSTI